VVTERTTSSESELRLAESRARLRDEVKSLQRSARRQVGREPEGSWVAPLVAAAAAFATAVALRRILGGGRPDS
jgi:hypothetical protein